MSRQSSPQWTRQKVVPWISAALIGLILFQFQNCAPPGKVAGDSSLQETDAQLRLIDDLNKTTIQFAALETEIDDAVDTTAVSGLCNRDHNGEKLKWSVWDSDDGASALDAGESSCAGGQFAVQLPELDQYVCGVPHLLVVESEWGESTHSYFVRRCQPLASSPVAATGMPAGTSCAMEYSADAVSACARVCYRDGKVISKSVVSVNQCSSLIASLSGH